MAVDFGQCGIEFGWLLAEVHAEAGIKGSRVEIVFLQKVPAVQTIDFG